MMVNGKTIYNMDLEQNPGMIAHNIKANILKVKSMVLVHILGKMDHNI